jgi:hypothetical protein
MEEQGSEEIIPPPVRMPESNPFNGKRHPFDGYKIMK